MFACRLSGAELSACVGFFIENTPPAGAGSAEKKDCELKLLKFAHAYNGGKWHALLYALRVPPPLAGPRSIKIMSSFA